MSVCYAFPARRSCGCGEVPRLGRRIFAPTGELSFFKMVLGLSGTTQFAITSHGYPHWSLYGNATDSVENFRNHYDAPLWRCCGDIRALAAQVINEWLRWLLAMNCFSRRPLAVGLASRGYVEPGVAAQNMHKLPMHQSRRCGAYSRRSGKPCRNGGAGCMEERPQERLRKTGMSGSMDTTLQKRGRSG